MNTTTQNQKSELKNYLYFAGTIYDSFEALEEVFAAAGEKTEKSEDIMLLPQSQIKLDTCRYPQQLQ